MTRLLFSCALLLLATGSLRAEEPPATDAPAPPPPPAETATPQPSTEQRLNEVLRQRSQPGEAITLQVAGEDVLALYRHETRGKALGGVILLHDLNGNPDQPGVIYTLRRRLPGAGWHNLSLQLPHSDEPTLSIAQLDAARPRIAAAVAELERRDIANIVLIGHGHGAFAALDYLADTVVPSVQGLVVLGLDGRANDEPRLDGARALSRLIAPILDIYGSRDMPAVTDTAVRRSTLARLNDDAGSARRPSYADLAHAFDDRKARKLTYRQVRLPGADHDFSGMLPNLYARLRGWLERYTAGIEITTSSRTEK